MEKKLPFTKEQMMDIMKEYPTPFHIYDEKAIRENARRFQEAFSPLCGFREYFAVKANPNPHIIRILQSCGFGVDCSSLAELMIAQRLGIKGDEIMFSSNDTPKEEFAKARGLNAIINLDDISHIESLEKSAGIPDTICFRYNPGPLRKGNSIIGKPEEAKYGMTREQILEACKIMKKKGVKKIGLHTMIISNELNESYFIETAKMMFELSLEVSKKLRIKIDFVNLGGGIGIPYKPEQKPVSYGKIAKGIQQHYDEIIV
ncbi:MAG TPA: diaminopimelate decarboxylase, partial [Candidatus Nanoarchaeia archaeon]|nr:diaminopimelate decarboxylase [Candidatus Nanoarchaeia archaeon]